MEILAPSVKHSQGANLGAQMLGVRRTIVHQGLGGCAKGCGRLLFAFCNARWAISCGSVNTTWKYVSTQAAVKSFPFRRATASASGSLALRTAPIGTRVVHGGRDARSRTALHMAAQDRCSAVANILEGFLCCLARQHLSPSRPKIVFVYAENIRPVRADVHSSVS